MASPWLRSRRKSAGTLSPASSNTMSPGTRLSPSSVRRLPFRITAAFSASMLRMESMAFSALPSCITPIMALTMTTPKMTNVSIQCCSNAVRTPATIRTITSRLANCLINRANMPGCGAWGSLLGPYCCRRAETSSSVKPDERDDNAWRTSSPDCA